MRTSYKFLILTAILATCYAMMAARPTSGDESPASAKGESAPQSELDKVIDLGREIVMSTNTHPLSKPFVGNDLTCTSCHLDAGTDPAAATFLGCATAYPAWSPREERVITLEDRVLNCFMRSMNGTRPDNGSPVSVAITTYITSLSSGEKIAMNHKNPLGPNHVPPLKLDLAKADIKNGAAVYQDQCAVCHGDNGLGNEDGPPVWGPRSYNQGAGLAQVPKLASWLKVAMPLGDPSLTDQESLDLAAYINAQERPEFKLEEHLGEGKPNK
ncbi:c-type cytochrome [Aeoliella sp. SH292]|uniref:c-type cytochrome n=1 Tax=Aeoliella sp. SH292 TaxID=3454464 RepID=UPI003F9CFFB9